MKKRTLNIRISFELPITKVLSTVLIASNDR